MLPLAAASESAFLYGIWATSLVLATLAILMLIWLISTRIVRQRKETHAAERKKILSRFVFTVLNAPGALDGQAFPAIEAGDKPIICAIAIDMLRIVRGKDVDALMGLLDSWQVRDYLKKCVKSSRRGLRVRALALLARFHDDNSLQLLFSCAADKDPYVQMAALRGIASRQNPEHLPAIIDSLIASPNQRNTLMLTDVLKSFHATAVPHLLMLANSQATLEVRLAAIRTLASTGSSDAGIGLAELADHSETDIRAQSIAALGKLGGGAARGAVINALESPDHGVRAAAAQAAGMLGLQQTTSTLMEMMKDSAWWVRYRAACALYQLGSAGIDALRIASGLSGVEAEIAYQVLAEHEGLPS